MQQGHEVELSRVKFNQHREAALSRKDHQFQSMQQGHKAKLRRMDEVHRVAIGLQQWREASRGAGTPATAADQPRGTTETCHRSAPGDSS